VALTGQDLINQIIKAPLAHKVTGLGLVVALITAGNWYLLVDPVQQQIARQQGALRQVGMRPRRVDAAAVHGPDLHDEVELLVGEGTRLVGRDLALVAQGQGHLPQLVVEQRLGLAEHVVVGHAAHHRGRRGQQRQQREQQSHAQGLHTK